MRYKRFTSASEVVHKKFICKEFHLDFHDMGIDFRLDNETFIEMKCKKRYRKTVTFVCSCSQIELWEKQYPAQNLFWLFMLYDLTCAVGTVRTNAEIERRITNREIWLLPWSFIKAHKVHDYPSWGPHIHFTTKDFPRDLETLELNGVKYHYARRYARLQELFDRKEFLDP